MAFVDKIKSLKGRAKNLWQSRRAFLAVSLPALCAVHLVFFFTAGGETLNTAIFVKPAMKVRDLWKLSAKPSDRLRVIVYDDSSAELLKQPPSIDAWISIANHLADLGYRKVIFPEVFELPTAVPTVILDPRIQLIAGGAVHSRKFKTAAEQPNGLLDILIDSDKELFTTIPPSGDVLHAHTLNETAYRTGTVNLANDYQVRAGYLVGDSKFIPHIAFLAAPDLRISGSKMTSQAGIIPIGLGDSMYIEMLNPAAVAQVSVPVRAFFNRDQSSIRSTVTDRVKDAMTGGDTALFVVDGNTGSASFIDSYVGLVPTYYAVASMISGVVENRFLRDAPMSPALVLALSAILFIVALIVRPARSTSMTLALLIVTIIVAFGLYHIHALVLPTAQLAVVFLVIVLATQVQSSFQTWHDDLRRQKDLELGKVVQSLTLPSRMAGRMDKWEFQVAYEPYGPMSGDWVQVYENPDSEHEICGIIAIGDVVGKGPAAALNTASIASMWSHFKAQWDEGEFDIWKFLNTLNHNIHSTFGGNQMSSVAIAVLYKTKIQLINCGAPSWIHISPESKVEAVRTQASNPLGFSDRDFSFNVKELEVGEGSILLAHTDGVMDGGLARKTFARNVVAAGLPDEDAFSYLKREAQLAGAESVLADDFTMLYLKRCA